jgi:hypothetical protein
MMSTAPPLSLSRDQARRLQTSLQTYRHYAFASLAPSTGRNQTLRALQALQGRLIEAMDQQTARLQLILTAEEMVALKAVIMELLTFYARQPESAERVATLGDLATLRSSLKGLSGEGAKRQ